jgi:hypothetical protein
MKKLQRGISKGIEKGNWQQFLTPKNFAMTLSFETAKLL